ncbi:hypothetical protein D3C78_1645260 [compost metagenome]
MRLAQQGGHQHPTTATHVAAGQLIGEDGLTGPRRPLDNVGGASYQATLEQRVEPVDPRYQPLQCLCHDVYLSSGLSVWS